MAVGLDELYWNDTCLPLTAGPTTLEVWSSSTPGWPLKPQVVPGRSWLPPSSTIPPSKPTPQLPPNIVEQVGAHEGDDSARGHTARDGLEFHSSETWLPPLMVTWWPCRRW